MSGTLMISWGFSEMFRIVCIAGAPLAESRYALYPAFLEGMNDAIAMMGGRADVVMSDMAPNTTGHRKTDQLRIVGLIETAAAFATDVLNPGGTFLAKAFQSGADAELVLPGE